MEEEPAMAVPDTEQEQDFMVSSKKEPSLPTPQDDDFDLSDLSVKPKEKSREDIVAEAEAAAFAEADI